MDNQNNSFQIIDNNYNNVIFTLENDTNSSDQSYHLLNDSFIDNNLTNNNRNYFINENSINDNFNENYFIDGYYPSDSIFSDEIMTSINEDNIYFDNLENFNNFNITNTFNTYLNLSESVFDYHDNDKEFVNFSNKKINNLSELNLENNILFLNLSKNNIITIKNNDLINLTNLLCLKLNFNKIKNIEDNSLNYNLQELILSNNNINDIIINNIFLNNNNYNIELKHLNLSKNFIYSINRLNFENIINLSYLNLSFNNINYVDDDSFTCLINLKELYLNNNKLNKFNLSNFKNLIYISLSNNNIADININSLPSIKSIDLEHNNISSINIKKIFDKNINLIELNLKENPLYDFIMKNDIICNCHFCNNICKECPICLNEYDIYYKFIYCNHITCFNCIKILLNDNINSFKEINKIDKCPICRSKLYFSLYFKKNINN